MQDEIALLNGSPLTIGREATSPHIAGKDRVFEWPVVAPADDWLRTGESPRGVVSFPRSNGGRRQEVVLTGTQLLSAAGASLCGIFLFVWALTKLWLFGR